MAVGDCVMAKFTVGKGLNEYLTQLENLEFRADGMAGLAIYEGAKIVADAIRANISAMPTTEDYTHGSERRDPLPVEKSGMLAGLGISKKSVDGGFINVKIGMHGYNKMNRPNVVVIRTFEAGNSFCSRLAPVARAVRATRAAAEAAIKAKIEEELQKMMK